MSFRRKPIQPHVRVLEQIQFLLADASALTTERYLGSSCAATMRQSNNTGKHSNSIPNNASVREGLGDTYELKPIPGSGPRDIAFVRNPLATCLILELHSLRMRWP
jgi:hypothetical protein